LNDFQGKQMNYTILHAMWFRFFAGAREPLSLMSNFAFAGCAKAIREILGSRTYWESFGQLH